MIRELEPECLEDFLYFFEHVAHTDHKEWDRCYCLNYCSDDQIRIEGYTEFGADARRKYAIQYVNSGAIRGYLAYIDGKVVGWCNVNDQYFNFCGPEKLYFNAGFTKCGETQKRNIMRKKIMNVT